MPSAPIRRLPRHSLLSLIPLIAFATLACGRKPGESKEARAVAADSTSVAWDADVSGRVGEAMLARQKAGGFAAIAASDVASAPLPTPSVPPADSRMLIRTADVAVRVDSLEVAMAALRRLAAALGGSVGNVSVSVGDYEVRSATLELRIPAARFDDAMAGIPPIGKVERNSISAADVGEEYVDVTARVDNAKRLENRLIQLLATRTGKLTDVLAVERELARVRQEIERHEGRRRYLGARVTTSTISVTVSERAPLVGANPGRSVLGEAFVNAWRNFVGFVALAIESLGVVLPLLALAWGAWRVVRARRQRRTGA